MFMEFMKNELVSAMQLSLLLTLGLQMNALEESTLKKRAS
uniref:Uncharacterized protein n=1 Tax=Utricularia reniformis TaxID=192314 RepID=A0A1Y0B1D9_9LAMI|nr:hypothetical protein AEK19_MT0978 [Utricularia reniformis]ART31201.1 hypothetical protein AEK19_MT0978 [Utricularia reniformis]